MINLQIVKHKWNLFSTSKLVYQVADLVQGSVKRPGTLQLQGKDSWCSPATTWRAESPFMHHAPQSSPILRALMLSTTSSGHGRYASTRCVRHSHCCYTLHYHGATDSARHESQCHRTAHHDRCLHDGHKVLAGVSITASQSVSPWAMLLQYKRGQSASPER